MIYSVRIRTELSHNRTQAGSPCGSGVGACKISGAAASVGSANNTVEYVDGRLTLTYTGGATCANGGAIKSVISFACATEVGGPRYASFSSSHRRVSLTADTSIA